MGGLLVLRPGALGDTLLAVPALRALRRLGFAPLTLAAHGSAARLLAFLGEVDRGMAFDDPSLGWLFSPKQGGSEAMVAWMQPGGMPAAARALVLAASRPPGEEVHCARYLVQTLAGLGVDGVVDERPFALSPIACDEVLVHAGSGSATKNWPARHFAATIRAVEGGVRMIVGEADHEAAQAVEACLGRRLPRLEHAPLEHLAARLAGCRGYVGNDSGVSHLAGLSGARTVAIFGPTSPEVWRPLGPEVHVFPFDTPPERVAWLLQDST